MKRCHADGKGVFEVLGEVGAQDVDEGSQVTVGIIFQEKVGENGEILEDGEGFEFGHDDEGLEGVDGDPEQVAEGAPVDPVEVHVRREIEPGHDAVADDADEDEGGEPGWHRSLAAACMGFTARGAAGIQREPDSEGEWID